MMKKINQKTILFQARQDQVQDKLLWAAVYKQGEVLENYRTGLEGLAPEDVERNRETWGENTLDFGKKDPIGRRLAGAFLNPFSLVLLVLAGISLFTDVIFAPPGEQNGATAAIITVMVALSGGLRFIQETRSGNVAAKLSKMLSTTAAVERQGIVQELPLQELVAGDIVHLAAGDMVPGDLRILAAKDLFLSQSALTGESEPVEKTAAPAQGTFALTEAPNLAFLGSNVISGSAKALVVGVGTGTLLGTMAKSLDQKPPKTTFEKGVNSVSWVLIRFMLIMVPVVLFLNGTTKGDWLQALMFAISIAVGLTPEMLPMIVTTSLAKGALAMSREKVIIKNLNAIQNLGSMDILCTDKTGTLTQDRSALEYHLNVDGKEDPRVLRHAFLNSWFQTGLKNLMDAAIIEKQRELGSQDLEQQYTKVDEIPFDFQRRRMSVVVRDRKGKTQLVTKGAVEEILGCCGFVEWGGQVLPLSDSLRMRVLEQSDHLNRQGMRVVALAQKTNPSPVGKFSTADEENMVLLGFLAFLDPPKETTAAAIQALKDHGVAVKVLTGDNEKVTQAICRKVGLDGSQVLLGDQVEALSDQQLGDLAETVTVFAKLSPQQKARVVTALRQKGHCVGYMGDGINDAAAMKAADVGISVDAAVDIAKEAASVVLLQKDLLVLERGVLEGRKTYANMIKYIKMTASSNFGNMLSVLAASAFLPFLPMASLHLLLLNLIYDISCMAMSWDNVDSEYLQIPRKWEASGIVRFMLWIGPVSSLFDILTFLTLYFVLCPALSGGLLYSQLGTGSGQDLYAALFQTGWFVASMWTQTLVIHCIRTPKLPFVQSRASLPVTFLSLLGIGLVTAIPFSPLAGALGLVALPPLYFPFLAAVTLGYGILVTVVKKLYIHRFGQWL